MSKPTLYHNPRCSKSRQALELLKARGIEAEIVEYLKTPPDAQQLEQILDMLALDPRQLMRTNEAEYKDNNLADPNLTRSQLIQAMVEHPKLIQRPIVIHDGKAALGRPPEAVLEIVE
jgi:arsenate reductase